MDPTTLTAIGAIGGAVFTKLCDFVLAVWRERRSVRDKENNQSHEYGVLIGRLQADVAHLTTQLTLIQEAHEKCHAENASLRIEVDSLKNENTELRAEIAVLRVQITGVNPPSSS